MSDSHRYAMLLNALPHHGPLFGARQTPLSRIRLQQRLALLEPEDAETLRLLGRLLDWSGQRPDRTDEDAVSEATRLLDRLDLPFARELAIWRLELRTLVAALRRRRRGEAPPAGRRWGFGRWLGQIQRHWHETAFRLEGAFPWLPEAVRLLDQGDALGLERRLLGAVWDRLERLSDGHVFDVEAVILYVQRWELIDRWTANDGEAAMDRFDALVAAAGGGVDFDDLPRWRPGDSA